MMKLSVCSSSDQGRWEAAGHCYSVIRLVTVQEIIRAWRSTMYRRRRRFPPRSHFSPAASARWVYLVGAGSGRMVLRSPLS